ncbi:MAG TPA: hypothetical protein VGO64_07230 [Candidatus Limnocylindrales bacterium]|nr:hypothetical protein [Candidatus Limnocylindrales bacterium]
MTDRHSMKGGDSEMQSFVTDRLRLINAMRADQIRQAGYDRRFASPAPSIRRALGTSIARFGTRLAGESTYELARTR